MEMNILLKYKIKNMEQYIRENFDLDFFQNLNADGFSIKSKTYLGQIEGKEHEVIFLYVDGQLNLVKLNGEKMNVKKFEKKMAKILKNNYI